jgi:hypothetical protein
MSTDPPTDPPPGMIGPSPSERGLPAVPADPAEHAARAAREWQDVAESYVRRRMKELGIPEERIGSPDHHHGLDTRAFNPHECDAGGVSPDGRINVDAGVLDPDRAATLNPPAPEAWRKARLRTRIDAAIAHEDMEYLTDSHDLAVELAPETDLPIGKEPRRLLRAIRLGSQGFRGGPSSRIR